MEQMGHLDEELLLSMINFREIFYVIELQR
jgi:hypothetical protein